jgi:NAD(P)-dependent dehydrogenase (short-subunit alcohol dehydrogenase family)
MLAVNLRGVRLRTRHAPPHMIAGGPGCIVNLVNGGY